MSKRKNKLAPTAREKDPFYHEEFLCVVQELTDLRLKKVKQYGTARYEIQDRLTNRWLAYSDVLRKFIRLKQQMQTGDEADLLETYMDLFNYAGMAVQLLKRKE